MSEMTNEQAVDVVRENNTVARFDGHLTTLHQTATLTAVLAEVDRLRAVEGRLKWLATKADRTKVVGQWWGNEIDACLEASNATA